MTALVSALIIAVHLLTRNNSALMAKVSDKIVRPVHRAMSVIWSHVPFSGAELLIGLSAAAALAYIVWSIFRVITGPDRLRVLYRAAVTLSACVLAVYALFCILWGVYYYGEDFETESGIECGEISVEQLAAVTEYFAEKLNSYSTQVPRDADGLYDCNRQAVLSRSGEVFREAERLYPCLEGPDICAKGIYFSRVMSYTDFTGFFFPFTAEANVNTDYPPGEFPATVAHELSHQRGVAKEQEANFTAVLACLTYGDPEFCYSACMLAYTHLGNALYSADYEAWLRIAQSLDENVLKDFRAAREYWKQFETPVQTVSNTVYEGFLQSYDQKLGLKSYGACVDLLVNYYYGEAAVS